MAVRHRPLNALTSRGPAKRIQDWPLHPLQSHTCDAHGDITRSLSVGAASGHARGADARKRLPSRDVHVTSTCGEK